MKMSKRLSDKELGDVVYAGDSPIHGRGLFAARALAAGDYIGTFDGPETQADGDHVLWVYEHENDPSPVGRIGENLLRFLNHATPCNAAFDGFDLYAECAIAPDEEITIDYAWA